MLNGGENQHMVDGILRNVEKLSSMLGTKLSLNIYRDYMLKEIIKCLRKQSSKVLRCPGIVKIEKERSQVMVAVNIA